MIRTSAALLFFMFILAFQTAFASKLSILGVKPDFLLISVIMWGITFGPRKGAAMGFFAGFLEDVLSASFYMHSFINALSGFLAAAVKGSFAFSSVLTSVVSVAMLTAVSYLLKIASFYFFFGRALPSLNSVLVVLIFSVLYNSAITALVCTSFERLIVRYFSPDDGSALKEYTLYRL